MKKIVLAVALLALAGVALADGLPGPRTPGPGGPQVADDTPAPKATRSAGEQ